MVTYKVVSTSRESETRTVRALNPGSRGAVQFLSGTFRLIRNRPLILSEDQIRKHLSELKDKQNNGMLIVTTMDDRRVSLSEENFLSPAAPKAVEPKPDFPLDSITRDDPPPGIPMSNLPGGIPAPTKDFEFPAPIGVVLEDMPAEEVTEEEPKPSQQYSGKKNKRY